MGDKIFILRFEVDEVLIFRMAFLSKDKAEMAKDDVQKIFLNTDKHFLEVDPIIEINLYDKSFSTFIEKTYLAVLSCPSWEKGEK